MTIPKEVREKLGIRPGDEIQFSETDEGFVVVKQPPATEDGSDPFEKYRGYAESDTTMPERMRDLRDEYPRDPDD